MKEGWTYKKLGEVATFARGLTYSKNDEVEQSNNIVLRSNNIDLIAGKLDFSELKYLKADFAIPEDKRLRKGSLFICMSNGSKAHLGKVAYVDKDYGYAFGGFMGQITPNNDVDGLYLHYALSSPLYKEYIKSLSEGANINNLKYKDLAEFVIKYPSLSEQQSIVDYLDSAFAKIDAMKANAEKALNEAKALFQASLKEMLEPKEGWEEKRMDEVCSIARGGSPRPIKDFITDDPNGLNWIKIGDTDMGGKYIYSTKEKIKPEGLKKSRWVEEDEFLLSNSMSFGRPYILKTNGCIHDGWLVLRDYQNYMNIDFFYYLLSSENVQRQFRTKAQGSTVSNLNTDRVASVTIFVPPLTEQQSIVATLDSLKTKVDRLQENFDKISQECDALKQAILRQVFE